MFDVVDAARESIQAAEVVVGLKEKLARMLARMNVPPEKIEVLDCLLISQKVLREKSSAFHAPSPREETPQ
jgi:hypothetical protein